MVAAFKRLDQYTSEYVCPLCGEKLDAQNLSAHLVPCIEVHERQAWAEAEREALRRKRPLGDDPLASLAERRRW
jgi:transcription initiation factor IIE alpha subunit